MKLRTLGYYFRQALLGLRRSGWLTVAAVATVSISLFLLGLFILIILNVNLIARAVESEVEAVVFLETETPRETLGQLEEALRRLPGVAEVRLVTKEEGLRQLSEHFGPQHDLLRALGGKNPLPDCFRVRTARPADVPLVAQAAAKLRYVEEVKYGQGLVERLLQVTRWLRVLGTAIIVLLAMAAVVLVAIAIRMTVFARRREIGIMKYVGATDWFIRWPFFLEGMLLGLIGAAVAGFCLYLSYAMLMARLRLSLAFLPLLSGSQEVWQLVGGLVVGGIALGSLGSLISVRRFLQV
ncbi:MAG: ABC transporter permease [Clostridia bacterium]|nr:ABC transporter permease [Clostridia bacterium]